MTALGFAGALPFDGVVATATIASGFTIRQATLERRSWFQHLSFDRTGDRDYLVYAIIQLRSYLNLVWI